MRDKIDAGALEPRLDAARRAIAEWRRDRRPGMGMPEAHWAEAVALAGALGVYDVARFLPVDLGALKKRVSAGAARERTAVDSDAGFVALEGARLLAPVSDVARSWTPPSTSAVIELSSSDGARMMVRVDAGAPVDVLGLAHAFWSRGRA